MAALVGMAALFAGASRAVLASVVFAFEATHQSMGLLPLLAGCATAYLIASLLTKHSIMTEKIARRGVIVPADYTADILDRLAVRDVMTRDVVSLQAQQTLREVREWLESGAAGSHHRCFPVLNESGELVSVASRRELLATALDCEAWLGELKLSAPVVVFDSSPLRDAAKLMAVERLEHFPVVAHDRPKQLVGMLASSDILGAHRQQHAEDQTSPDLRATVAP
jgi:CIC family chloride channel protein